MKKKNIATIISLIIFAAFAIFIYQFYLSKAKSFPTEEQLVQGINDLFPEANANVIQDTLFLDEKHLFVPFISNDDKLAYLKFYLIRDRGFHITQGIETYYPKVQMESLKEKSYGILQLPGEWTSLMNAFIKVNSKKQSDLFFNNFFSEQHVFFGWIPYDDSDNEKFPE